MSAKQDFINFLTELQNKGLVALEDKYENDWSIDDIINSLEAGMSYQEIEDLRRYGLGYQDVQNIRNPDIVRLCDLYIQENKLTSHE